MQQKKHAVLILIFMLGVVSYSLFPGETPGQSSMLHHAMQKLEQAKIPKDHEAVLILKRLDHYLDEIRRGRSHFTWQSKKTRPVYNFLSFARMTDHRVIETIVQNTLDKKDPFHSLTGLLERAYISEYDKAIDSYMLYIPPDYQPDKKYPVILFLHGYGDGVYMDPLAAAHTYFLKTCKRKSVILVAPNGIHRLPDHPGYYRDESERDVLRVLDMVKEKYSVDERRVYLTGLSMGGNGTWSIAARHPQLFAAIAPVCGFGTGKLSTAGKVDLKPLVNMPVFAFHGDSDKTVPVSETREMVKQLKALGGNVIYKELKGYNHNAWDYAYSEANLIQWFLKYKKD